MNYGRESLVPGEKVLQILLQPEIREPLWKILGKTFYKPVALAHLTILTDRELILIQDAQRKTESKKSEYGGTWQYIPLHCINSIQISKTSNERIVLSIQVQPNQTLDRLFEASSPPELEQLCARFQELVESVPALSE